jgi:hypothetical protein
VQSSLSHPGHPTGTATMSIQSTSTNVTFAATAVVIDKTGDNTTVTSTVNVSSDSVSGGISNNISTNREKESLSTSKEEHVNTVSVSWKDSSTQVLTPVATTTTTPPVSNKTGKNKNLASKLSVGDDAFSDFGYWRVPIPLIDEK